jgi:hypothetical protein
MIKFERVPILSGIYFTLFYLDTINYTWVVFRFHLSICDETFKNFFSMIQDIYTWIDNQKTMLANLFS